jgi:acyl-CoA thioester hydrolase
MDKDKAEHKDPKPGRSLAEYPIVITMPVQWGDQDAFQHVNNTVYFRWFETARILYGERIGLTELMKAENIGPILASITCHYRRPITYPDTVHVGARITRIGRTSLTMDHTLLSEAAGDVAAEGTSTLVVYDYTKARSHPVPDNLRKAIEELEGRTF